MSYGNSGWKLPLQVIWSNPLLKAGPALSHIGLLRTASSPVLGIADEGDFTVSLDNLCQCLMVLVFFFFLISNHFPSLQLVPVASHPVTVPLQNESVSIFFITAARSCAPAPCWVSTGFTPVWQCLLCTGEFRTGQRTQYLGQREITTLLHWLSQPSVWVSLWPS